MSLSRGEIVPLGVLKMRKLSFIPEHFSKITIDPFVNIKFIDQWINYHLNSRYAIKHKYVTDQNQKLISVFEIGLEDPREITMLTLSCPFLYKNTKEFF
jgi:hypothetical protein